MKITFAFLLFAVCLAVVPTQASNLNTTSNLEDEGIEPAKPPKTVLDGIPLMQELQPESDKDLVRILPEFTSSKPVVTVGIVDVDDVYNFYKRTLPPLGWNLSGGRDYHKGNKHLHINAVASGKLTTVTFTEE